MAKDYRITATRPWKYEGPDGRLVNGFCVYFIITDYGETHQIYAPSLDPATVNPLIEKLVADRKALEG